MTSLLLFVLFINLLLLVIIYWYLPKPIGLLFFCLCLFFPSLSFALYVNLGQSWLSDKPLSLMSLQRENVTTGSGTDSVAISQETKRAFAALTPSERKERINMMVASLSERLYRDGGNPQDWLRLARAHSVLQEKNKARRALIQAEETYPTLVKEKSWLAASLAVLLVSPLDADDKERIKQQLAQASLIIGKNDPDIKNLEQQIAPLLE